MIPYELIGFVTFWFVIIPLSFYLGYIIARIGRQGIISKLQSWDDKLWEDVEKYDGETPDGWKYRATFYNHILICLLSFRKPIAFRWKTYRSKFDE